jgi:hypothetical protein
VGKLFAGDVWVDLYADIMVIFKMILQKYDVER